MACVEQHMNVDAIIKESDSKITSHNNKENTDSPKKQKTQHMSAGLNIVLKFARLTHNAYKPTRGSKYAAGYDLYSAYDTKVAAKGKALVKTDIQIALPPGCYGRVAPRSGLAWKSFIDVGAGVIDQDYRGNVGVVLFNFADADFEIKKGDRIAQLVLERIYTADLEECDTLDETDRGDKGYGSTGVKLVDGGS